MLDTMDAVLDVGGIYDPATDRYDHHQRGFEQAFGHGFVTKLSSAGLVYKVCDCLHLQTLNPQPHLCYSVSTTSPPCATGNHQLRLTQDSLQHYGQEIIAKELGLDKEHADVQQVFLAVYKSFVEV